MGDGEWTGGSEGRYYKLREEWAEGGREGGRVFKRELGRVEGRKGGSEGVYYKGREEWVEGGREGGRVFQREERGLLQREGGR